MAIVEVRPLPIKKWHGKSGKEAFAVPIVVEVLYDETTGKYATGLTEEEAKEYGAKMGVDLSDTFNPNEAHPYFGTSKIASIILQNNTMLFDTNKPVDFVKVKNMKASKFVANSLKEWEEGKYPNATHCIYDEEENVAIKSSRIQLRNKALSYAMKMSLDDKIAMVRVLSKESVKGRSVDFIEVALDEAIRERTEDFLTFCEMGRAKVQSRATIMEACFRNILTKEPAGIFYMGEFIADDYDNAATWLNEPKNDKIKMMILQKLNG